MPAHALFVDYRLTDGRRLEPEIFPRPDGEVYVCGMADPAPLPDSPDAVEVSDEACAVLARAAGRVSTRLAAAPVTRRQACYRPVTDDGLPLIGPVPGVAGAFVATGHGPWGMLNAPATGQALAELIVEGAASTVDLRPFDPARLAPLGPGEPGAGTTRPGSARRGAGLRYNPVVPAKPAIGHRRDRSVDGIHDLGGMHGFGPVEADPEERGFHAWWEAHVVACVDAGIHWRLYTIDEFRHSRERLPPVQYLEASYFEQWLDSACQLLVEKGIVSREELEARVRFFADHPDREVGDAVTPREPPPAARASRRHASGGRSGRGPDSGRAIRS